MKVRILVSCIGWVLTAIFIWLAVILDTGLLDMIAKATGILVFMVTLGITFIAGVEFISRTVFGDVDDEEQDGARIGSPTDHTVPTSVAPVHSSRRGRRSRRAA